MVYCSISGCRKKLKWNQQQERGEQKRFLGKQFTPSLHGHDDTYQPDSSRVRKPTDHRCMPSGGHSSIDSLSIISLCFHYVWITIKGRRCSFSLLLLVNLDECCSQTLNALPRDGSRSCAMETIDPLWLWRREEVKTTHTLPVSP